MINLTQVSELMSLEKTLEGMNKQLTNALFHRYRAAIEEIGHEFLEYFRAKGLSVSTREDLKSSPQSKYFIASLGRVEFNLRCQFRRGSGSTEYFVFEITDDNFRKSDLLIDIKPNEELSGYYIKREGTTEEKIAKIRQNLQNLQDQVNRATSIQYTMYLRDGSPRSDSNALPNITMLLQKIVQ